jgi:hypothetical protein
VNEALTLSDAEGELALSAMMGLYGGRAGDGLDLKNLSVAQGADYLWHRFSSTLER